MSVMVLTFGHYGYVGRRHDEGHDCHEFPGFLGRSSVLRDRHLRPLPVCHG
jgi:hypothetical protein